MSIRTLRTSEMVVDAANEAQIRASINIDAVADYAEAMRGGIVFPPVTVFNDNNRYLLADGFHRVMAAARIGRETIEASVEHGTRSDALRFALTANVSHGLRRTNADKRKAIRIALTEWPRLSDRQIAETCAVGHPLVAEVRRQLEDSSSSSGAQTRIGADGRVRRLPQRRQQSVAGPHEADLIFWLQELVERADYELEGSQREQFKNELEFASREMK